MLSDWSSAPSVISELGCFVPFPEPPPRVAVLFPISKSWVRSHREGNVNEKVPNAVWLWHDYNYVKCISSPHITLEVMQHLIYFLDFHISQSPECNSFQFSLLSVIGVPHIPLLQQTPSDYPGTAFCVSINNQGSYFPLGLLSISLSLTLIHLVRAPSPHIFRV